MLAPSAVRHDPNSVLLPHLIKKHGFKKLKAVCAVMRKPLHAIHAMLKNRTPCDNRRFYFYTPTETAAD